LNNLVLKPITFLLVGFLLANLFLDVVLAQTLVREVGDNLAENWTTAEERIPQNNSSVVSGTNSIVQLLGEIMAPVYQLATPGSNLTYDIYRYLMKHTETELGIDKDFFRRLKRKVDAPTVDIVFAPTNPKEGQPVTAFAVPSGFRNSKDRLYFTWYLVHKGQNDVQAGRDEAMGMVARGGYDRDLFGKPNGDDGNRDAYNASFGGNDGVGAKSGKAIDQHCEGCDCLHNMTMFAGEVERGCFDDKGQLLYSNLEEYREAVKDVGQEKADWGKGAVNSDWITRCYRHNFGRKSGDGEEYSGRDLIIKCQHAFDSSLGGSDNSFGRADEDKWVTNPANPDTDGDGVVDEADLVGLGQDEFTWIYHKGDRVTVAVEGTSNIMINEGATNRLRYKNKHHTSGDFDLSPTASPEEWYKEARNYCETRKNDCLASTGDSMNYVPVSSRLPDDSECVRQYADCMKDVWQHQWSGNDEDSFGDLTGYYKIMWAAPGICSQENKDEAENDWCDSRDDFGFQYLKLYDPVERGKQLMKVSVNISPKNPQFFEPTEDDCNMLGGVCYMFGDGTDMILASADIVGDDNVDPDYLYYKWSVWRCDKNDFTNCEDVTSFVYPVSQKEGIGVRDFGFYPMNPVRSLFKEGENEALLKVGVVVKKHKNATMSSPGVSGVYEQQIGSNQTGVSADQYVEKYAYTASQLIKVHKNDLAIKLYTAVPDGSGGWKKGREICNRTGSLYKKVCPVFPYQVLMAELDTRNANVDGGIVWKINGKKIKPNYLGDINTENNSPRVFFPVTGAENELGLITAIAKRGNDSENDNLSVTERIFSIRNPLAVITDKGQLTRRSLTKAFVGSEKARTFQGYQLWWILGYPSKEWATTQDSSADGFQTTVDIPIRVIPDYLRTKEDGTTLKTSVYLNGYYVGMVSNDMDNENANGEGGASGNGAEGNNTDTTNGESSSGNRENGTAWLLKNVMFTRVREGDVNTLKLKTLLSFDENYKKSMIKSFNIKPVNELYNEQTIEVKPITAEHYKNITGKEVSDRITFGERMRLLLASVINKIPDYLLSVFKLATVLVLVTMITFAVAYGLDVNQNQHGFRNKF